jgi:hypothetical protein
MPSLRYEELEHRLDELRMLFLPSKFDPTGLYEDPVYERTKAYRVLVHAEFESFIEDRVLAVVTRSFDHWKSSGVATTALLAVVAFKGLVHPLPESLAEAAIKKKFPDLEARVEQAKNAFSRYVRMENHGIKARNLIRMLMPIGITEADIDAQWLTTTEAWATARGEVAHKAAAKVQVSPDPHIELKIVNIILDGFRQLDEQVDLK